MHAQYYVVKSLYLHISKVLGSRNTVNMVFMHITIIINAHRSLFYKFIAPLSLIASNYVAHLAKISSRNILRCCFNIPNIKYQS